MQHYISHSHLFMSLLMSVKANYFSSVDSYKAIAMLDCTRILIIYCHFCAKLSSASYLPKFLHLMTPKTNINSHYQVLRLITLQTAWPRVLHWLKKEHYCSVTLFSGYCINTITIIYNAYSEITCLWVLLANTDLLNDICSLESYLATVLRKTILCTKTKLS